MPSGSPFTPRRALVLAWIAATLALSGALGAASRTGALVAPLLLDWGLSEATAAAIHVLLRKAGHVLAYAGFALLVRWAWPGPGRARRALLLALALALADEALQSLSSTRGASVLDVLLDVGAAASALALAETRAAARGARPS